MLQKKIVIRIKSKLSSNSRKIITEALRLDTYHSTKEYTRSIKALHKEDRLKALEKFNVDNSIIEIFVTAANRTILFVPTLHIFGNTVIYNHSVNVFTNRGLTKSNTQVLINLLKDY